MAPPSNRETGMEDILGRNGAVLRRLIGATVIAAIPLVSGAAHAQNQQPIRVGLLLSGSGPGGAAGAAAAIGARMAVAEINQAGGILGRQIEVVAGDDQSDTTIGQNEA